MFRISVERNPRDSRTETWTPSKYKGRVFECEKRRVDAATQKLIVEKLRVRSIKQANEERRSLAVLLPADVPKLSFKEGEVTGEVPASDLFGQKRILKAKQRFEILPRLEFVDEDGLPHNLGLRDWGCYELIRKKGTQYALQMLSEALNISTAAPLFCGNFANHRTAWCVISMFSSAVHARPNVGEAA